MSTNSYDPVDIINAMNVGEQVGLFTNAIARVSWAEGRKVRMKPDPYEEQVPVLPFNTLLFIDRKYRPNAKESLEWYRVFSAQGTSGWIRSDSVQIRPPDLPVDTKLYSVLPGDNLWKIARAKYHPSDEWGSDTRFYVGAIAYVNRATPGIIIPSNIQFNNSDAWEKLNRVRQGTALWLPEKKYLEPLKGEIVSSGSWYFDRAHSLYRIVRDAFNWAVEGVAFVAGLVHGALLSVYDLFMDALELLRIVYKVIYNYVTGTIIEFAEEIYNSIVKFIKNIGVIAETALEEFRTKWNSKDLWDRGYFQGTVIGYIFGNALIILLTMGISALVSVMGKSARFASIAEKVAALPKFRKIAEAIPATRLENLNEITIHVKRKFGVEVHPRLRTATTITPSIRGIDGPGLSASSGDKSSRSLSESRGLADNGIKKKSRATQTELPSTATADNILGINIYTTPRQFRESLAKYFHTHPKHPLIKVFDSPNKKLKPSTKKGMDEFYWHEHPEAVQAGHVVSTSSGAPDKIVLMTAYENQMLKSTVEGKGAKAFIAGGFEVVIIDGIPITVTSAKHLVQFGQLSPRILRHAMLRKISIDDL